MRIKALMVDVDGVIVVPHGPGGWSANLERDLGLPAQRLQETFFRPLSATSCTAGRDCTNGCARC